MIGLRAEIREPVRLHQQIDRRGALIGILNGLRVARNQLQRIVGHARLRQRFDRASNGCLGGDQWLQEKCKSEDKRQASGRHNAPRRLRRTGRGARYSRLTRCCCGKVISKMNAHTKHKRAAPKARKTYTLSPELVEFLEATRKRRRAPSVSSVLQDILQAARREEEKARVEKAVADYYGSLSREEADEQSEWGEFAMREFPAEAV